MTKIDRLAEMFPECITETERDGKLTRAINFDTLRELLSGELTDGRESYEFNFVGKKSARRDAHSKTTKTLRPDRNLSRDFDTTKNLYIEGDNLDALKILQESYLGRVKLIYIDPPYNTGNDFIYRDDFSRTQAAFDAAAGILDDNKNRLRKNSDSGGRFHSDWCAMIYARLEVAKNFLTDDGVIFISIDDHEQANLKKICDEIFGEKNFVAQICVVTNPSGRDYGGVARTHEYILAYRKSELLSLNLITDDKNPFTLFDELGGFELRELRNRNIRFNDQNRPNLYYPFYVDTQTVDEHGLNPISLEPKDGWLKLYPMESQGIKTVWRWGKEKSAANLNVNISAKRKRDGGYMIVEKYREPKKMARSVWTETECRNEQGTLLIKKIFGGKVFDYPKSLETIMRLLEMGTDAESIVMDFFSGSATTAQAVMELNVSDGGRRKFIMIQLPEVTPEKSEARRAGYETICDIGRERIRRAGNKLLETHPELDAGFRVLKVDETNFAELPEITQTTLPGLVDNIKPDRDAWDLLFGALLEMGLTIDLPVTSEELDGFKILRFGEEILACFDKDIPEEIFRELMSRRPKKLIFRDRSFKTSAEKLNALKQFKTFAPDTEVKIL